MLQELVIKNLALIERIELQFNPGFTTLTGETGAGKSILLDALGLTLGERADSTLVRHNTAKADVTALFDLSSLPDIQNWLAEQELDEDNQCYLRRTVTAEGRSKAYINGNPVPAGLLKNLGSKLIDIHGQHEHQNLLATTKQIHLLDAYANHSDLLQKTKQYYQEWQQLKKQLHELENSQADYQSKLELLSFQNNEFSEISPQEGEFTELSEEQNQLSHANEIKQACEIAYSQIEAENGVVDCLNQAINNLQAVADFSPELDKIVGQLNSSLIEIQETSSEIQHQSQQIDLDPQKLIETEERLSALFGLAKKYNINAEELLEKQQQIQSDLEDLQGSDASLEQLSKASEEAWQNYISAANSVSKSRKSAAEKLAKTVTSAMNELGMANGLFEIEISETELPTIFGNDKVMFLVTANRGQPLLPLSKVASGGELSRISLAIQVATSEVASLPTLIFDEVDVGIGGGIAEVVGEKMQTLGAGKQILSITHLAQVAAHGHNHLKISKQSGKESTTTQVNYLTTDQRISEMARMLGGKDLTEKTHKHAKEMLTNAQKK